MKIKRLNRLIIKTHPVVFILSFLLLSIVITLPVYFGLDTGGKEYNDTVEMLRKGGFIIFFLVTIIVYPLFETVVFQGAIIEAFRANINNPHKKFYFSIFFSSLIFSIFHFYNLIYFLHAFSGGLVLATAYYYAIYRRESAVLLISIIHGLRNLIPLIAEQIEKQPGL